VKVSWLKDGASISEALVVATIVVVLLAVDDVQLHGSEPKENVRLAVGPVEHGPSAKEFHCTSNVNPAFPPVVIIKLNAGAPTGI